MRPSSAGFLLEMTLVPPAGCPHSDGVFTYDALAAIAAERQAQLMTEADKARMLRAARRRLEPLAARRPPALSERRRGTDRRTVYRPVAGERRLGPDRRRPDWGSRPDRRPLIPAAG